MYTDFSCISYFSARKSCGDELKKALEDVVVPMFCNAAAMNSTEEQKAKLNKVRKCCNRLKRIKIIF